ncbi:hypothetical protein ABBQ38_000867 [Trebouxia sp. C0009 RCD-2024]
MSVSALRQLLLAELGQRDSQRFSDKHLQNLIKKAYTDKGALQDATREGLQSPPALPAALVDKLLKAFGPSGQQAPVSFWAKSYRQKLQALPAPESFGKVWSAFQTPQGNLLDEVEFDRHGPLLNIYRPRGAKGLPAAFANAAFGTFLEQKRSGELTTAACRTVSKLITILSDSYMDTTTTAAVNVLQPILGAQFVGKRPDHDAGMLKLVSEELLYYFRQVMVPDTSCRAPEPPLTSGEPHPAGIDGKGRLRLDGRASKVHVFILEGEGSGGLRNQSNPVMRLAARYAKVLADIWDMPVVTDTLLPGVGIEVVGQGLRIHAVFCTNKICC